MDVKSALSIDEVRRYRREGWTLIRGAVGGVALTRLREIFDQLERRREEASPDHDQKVVVEDYGKRLVITRDLWRQHPDLEAIARGLAPLAAELMGVNQVRLIGDGSYIKPRQAEGGQPTMWHQDSGLPIDRRGLLTVWVAVDDISLEQGPLTFLPGSHRLGLLGIPDQRGEEVELDSLLSDEDREYVGEPTCSALEAGDATVHDGFLLHYAGQNRTDCPRRGWSVRFIPATTLYTGAPHRRFDGLGLEPLRPFEHENFPLITTGTT